jgi:hypothetical protein
MKETKVNTVTMEDGRAVDFPGKRKMQKSSFYDKATDTATVRIDFVNFEPGERGKTIEYILPKVGQDKGDVGLVRFALHGAEQKLGDEAAGEENVEDAFLAIEALVGRLDGGEWSSRKEGGGMSGTSTLLRALVEFTGKPVEAMKRFLSDKTQTHKMALRQSTDRKGVGGLTLKEIVDRIEAEKAAKGSSVDVEKAIDELLAA